MSRQVFSLLEAYKSGLTQIPAMWFGPGGISFLHTNFWVSGHPGSGDFHVRHFGDKIQAGPDPRAANAAREAAAESESGSWRDSTPATGDIKVGQALFFSLSRERKEDFCLGLTDFFGFSC